MPDFTLKTYQFLISNLQDQGYTFQALYEFLTQAVKRTIILRHDVDRSPGHALALARIQHKQSIVGSYYFRAVPESWNEKFIREIHDLGHEVGYHYENMSTCKGEPDQAIDDFKRNLDRLRKLVPVRTICMHGSPRSGYDNKDLWEIFNYRDYDIIGEPYFDVDFSKVLYLTDTGRRWDGDKVSVRDRIETANNLAKKYCFHSTQDIIKAAEQGKLPDQILFTFHPQRWTDKPVPWVKELVMQNLKNVVKKYFFVHQKID